MSGTLLKTYFGKCLSRNFPVFWKHVFQSVQWIVGFVNQLDKLWLQREKKIKMTVMMVKIAIRSDF